MRVLPDPLNTLPSYGFLCQYSTLSLFFWDGDQRDPRPQMRQQRPENGTNLGVTRQVKGTAQPSWFPFTQEEPGSIKRDFSTSHVWSYFTLLRPQQAGLQHHIYRVGSKGRTGPEAMARRRQDSHPALQQPPSWDPESLASALHVKYALEMFCLAQLGSRAPGILMAPHVGC